MAFRFTKQEETRRADLRDKLEEARSTLDEKVAAEIEIIEDAYAGINEAIEKYNDVLSEARGFVEDIASERDGEFDDRSENWQEGERGQATREWIDSLQTAADSELEAVEEIAFEAPDVSPEDHSSILDNIPSEPEY
jgi:hypothetical protein